MTVREVLVVLVRRWYVVVLIFAIAAAAAFAMMRDGGIYTTRTVVAFTLPATTTLTFSNGLDDANVIAFAGAVAQEINNGRPPVRYSTDEAPFYGAGVREGVLVSLPSGGNQWVSSFLRAEIELQVVGRSYEWVQEHQSELVSRAFEVAEQQQSLVGIPPESRIEASVVPLTTQIEYVGASRSSQAIAVAAMAAAAGLASCWLALGFDRLVNGISSRGRPRPSSSELKDLGVSTS